MFSTFNFGIVFLSGILLALLVTGNTTGLINLAEVRQIFGEFKVPEDIYLPFDPVVLLELTYPQPAGAPPIYITDPGTQLPLNATVNRPQFAIYESEDDVDDDASRAADGPFVIAAIDPDAPTPQSPTVAQVLHFLGGGFHYSAIHDTALVLVNDTPAIAEYVRPQPPAGSPPHRYVFLLFKEPPSFSQQTVINSSASRPILNFNLSAFAATTGLGDPLGGTFIFVGPESG